MPSNHDSAGRPIVVVTGMGVVTSLGAGKADNWKNLTAGKSGIKNITRFATDGLKTRFAGTVDFVPAEPLSAPELSERLADLAAEEAVARIRHRPARRFPRPAVPRGAADRDRMAAAPRGRGSLRRQRQRQLRRPASAPRRPGKFTPYHERFLFGSVADHLADKFGTKGSPISLSTACASGATAIQLGVEAIRRGETERRALHRHRRLGQSGIADPLLAAVGAVDLERSARAGGQALRQEPRRLRHGRGRRRAGAGKPGIRQGARRQDPRRHRTAAARWPTPSTARARARTASRSSAASATRWPTRASTPDDIDYVNPHGTGTPENDKMEAMGVMAVFGERAKTLPISSNKSMIGHTLSAAGAVEAVFSLLTLAAPAHPADHQLPGARSRRSRSTWCRTWRATPRCATSSPIRSASAARTSRW